MAVKKGEYGKDFMKIKFNTDDNLTLNTPLRLHLLTIIVRCIFERDGKFYRQLYLDDSLYELLKSTSRKQHIKASTR